VATRFQTVEELIARLQAQRVREVRITSKVATSTSPGGEQITFRGRLVLSADLGAGDWAECIQRVQPYVTESGAPEIPIAREKASDLQRCQLALMCQLRAYRGQYQGVMEAARSSLTERLKRAGISVVEPEE
jgi:isoaspartyl peptidase/L-asparaginase-like protein (Ntn-hydrolase superfamily)